MDLEVWLALISSLSAIVIAVIGIFGTSFNKKRVLKAEKALEDFKVKLETEKVKYQLYSENTTRRFKFMGEFINLIQAFKDYILMLQTSNAVLEKEIVVRAISELKSNFFTFYQTNSQFMIGKSLDAAHNAKHLVNELDNYVRYCCQNGSNDIIHFKDDTSIKSIHSKLSDCQNTMRDARAEIITVPNEL
ncbi:hypothetical protein [Patiriisocius hiemis]|uniref:Uncharacterized protein n=1 Tax=Patiriisocius hiemis TaxID=3075604 RepID=A0ABU2YB91_9FLAO|nr:hypothetical protein [Constantimarinum sp. W242]MDT0555017.1 hypothetical protein [Constantimarinum sp. W242]